MIDDNIKYISRFQLFIGMNTEEIIDKLNIDINLKAKNLYSKLSINILGKELVEEMKNHGFVIKSVRLKSDLTPKEAISFPAFQYQKIAINEWKDSDLFFQLNKKYFFIFYSQDKYSIRLNCVRLWKMQNEDLEIAKKAWLGVKQIVKSGDIVKEIKRGKRITNFPRSYDNEVLHVRPHASNSNDVYILPTLDKKTGLNMYTKHSFWLNKNFIKYKILLHG